MSGVSSKFENLRPMLTSLDLIKAVDFLQIGAFFSNGFDFINDLVAFAKYGNEQVPDDSVFKFIDDRIEAQKKSLDELEKDDPLTTRMIGALGQDAAFVLPIYKKMTSAGIPKQYAFPASFAIGSTLAFDKETSFMLDTDMIKGLKDTINLNEDSPAEELFDKAVQGIEFTGLGYAFNKLYPMIKAMRKVDVQKAATVTAGSLAAGEGAKKVQENIQNNIISEQEIAIMTGDLYVAENVLTKERRMLMTSQISQFITTNTIQESTSKAQLLKG